MGDDGERYQTIRTWLWRFPAASTAERAVLTAVVYDADGVRFVASGHDEAELTERLVAYVRDRCENTLWPADARAVQRLIADDQSAEAIEAYFAKVGDRWDMERLLSLAPGRVMGPPNGGSVARSRP